MSGVTVRRMMATLGGVYVLCSCGGGDATESQGVVQLVDMTTTPLSGECAGLPPGGIENTYVTTFHIHIVNTTDEAVTINSVSATGLVIRATTASDVGTTAHIFASLPFTPTPAVLEAKRGELTVIATMTAGCGRINVPADFYRDIQTTVSVTTSAGQFNALPATIHVTWRAF